MNGFNRALLVVTGVIGLFAVAILLLGVYDVPQIQTYTDQWQNQDWYIYTILAIGIFLAVIFLLMLMTGLAAKSKPRRYTIQTNEGRITVSKDTIEKTVYESLKQFQGLRKPNVNVDIDSKRDEVRVHIDCAVFNREKLPTLGKEIQSHVKERIESLMEVPVATVSLNIHDTLLKTSERVV
ncbi:MULTISPECIES: alkaline shock response membrane anchor protein AmaP [Exiguobacterium]|uniref:alkaline shock response membrane anchor protein AmaP n=1 Tax=Exiguobacterium TaxID=33986 RepID=UPI001BE69E3C|nr:MULTISPECIES: alkaline shock response membrane anchor protein AmaP [Exiguobacterium]MCT4781607.1 alkaline shock response membrane anchor protein AmaP [Exiguobacterium himgiriensis]